MRRAGAPIVLLLVLATAWLWWPAPYGGAATYVITHGSSMAPGIAAGDLVVVRRADSYAEGDVVAYRSEVLGTTVLHRIVDSDAGRHSLRGDSNDFLDPEQPRDEDLHGRLALHVPDGGTWLRRLTAPPVLAACAFLLSVGGGAAVRTRRERKKERRTVFPRHRTATHPAVTGLPPALRPVVAGAAAVALAALVLTGAAFSRPTSTTVDASSSAASTMEFGYTAHVPASAAYDGTTVTAPHPVFRALADDVDVTYRYAGPPGTLTVDAELSAASGWQGTVPLTPARPVGEQHEGRVALDLSQLQDLADRAGQVIGVPATGLTVAVVPTLVLDGGGTFAPRLELSLDRTTLKPTGELTAKDETATTGTRQEPAQLSALGRSIDVTTARMTGPLLALVALIAGMVVVTLVRLAGPVSEAERIKRRHSDLVMTVMPMVLTAGRPLVDVADVETLVKLAERYGLPVLTWSRDDVDTYVVQDEGTTFRYRSGERLDASAELPAQRQPDETSALPADDPDRATPSRAR